MKWPLVCLACLLLGQVCLSSAQLNLAAIEQLIQDGDLDDPQNLSSVFMDLLSAVADFPYGREYRPDFAGFRFANNTVQFDDPSANNLNAADLQRELNRTFDALSVVISDVAATLLRLNRGLV